MTDPESVLTAPRWPYLAMTVACILGLAYTIRIAPLGVWRDGTIDWTFYAPCGSLLLAALAGLVHNVASILRPPMLRIADAGLTLRTAWRQRCWSWSAVKAIRLYSGGRHPFVGFSIDEGSVRRPVWLRYAFPVPAQDLFDTMRAASVASIGKEEAPTRNPALPRIRSGPLRIVRLAMLVGVVAFVSVAGIDALRGTTELISPVDPRLDHIANIGLWLILLIIVTAPLPRVDGYREPYPLFARCAFRLILLVLALPSMMAPAHVAARMTERAAFRSSRAPIEWWSYPIVGLTSSHKGSVGVELDPYDHPLLMPISHSDYDRYRGSVRYRDRLCYPLLTQREGNAIRIFEPQKPELGEFLIGSCPSRRPRN